jgi:outer membrane protein assembly factor BamD
LTFRFGLSKLRYMKCIRLFAILLGSLLLISCVTEPKVNLNTPEGLFKLGDFYQKQERYEEAINQYKALSNKHPYSKLAIEAELRVADCHFKKEDYIEAYSAYKIFKELHPRHAMMDYVTYHAAESLREDLPSTVDRDLTTASQAINYYEEITALYPQSKYAADAKEKRFKLIQMLADKELYIADFYFKQERYVGALTRYELFLQSFPLNQKVPYGLLRAALSAKYAKLPERAAAHVQKLISEHPKSSEASTAKKEFSGVAG